MRFEALLTARTRTRLGTETGTQLEAPAHGENRDAIRAARQSTRVRVSGPWAINSTPGLEIEGDVTANYGVPNLNVRRSTLLPERPTTVRSGRPVAS